MKIIVDENIVFGREAFGTLGRVTTAAGRSLTNEQVADAEAMIVRSVTKVNKKLLDGSKVKFVGTTTIGTDHIDLEYLADNGIAFAHAPGCNSYSVAEYVFGALSWMYMNKGVKLEGKTLGVIGCGNVGRKVARFGEAMGMEVLRNDPPLQEQTGDDDYVGLEDALECDVVTLHVPFTKTGKYKTHHLINEETLDVVNSGTVLINTSRGAVVDNNALKNRIRTRDDIHTILDVWENEPAIDAELLQIIDLGSAHIAGYSFEGKINGTLMVYDALCEHLFAANNLVLDLPKLENNILDLYGVNSAWHLLYKIFNKVYRVEKDYLLLRDGLSEPDIAPHFDMLRKHYRMRRELNNYTIAPGDTANEYADMLMAFRLNLS